MQSDTYKTIASLSEGTYSEKRSKFLAFALPVCSAEEVKSYVEEYQKRYYDARHLCYAYRLGYKGELFRANDNGEPSGTAGRPILGQLESRELTNVLVMVVRYFGGIKLGTGGLVSAYKQAASEALDAALLCENTIDEELSFSFSFSLLNEVMRIVKEENPRVLEQDFDNHCHMKLSTRLSSMSRLKGRLEQLSLLHKGNLNFL